jgi:hypothetical protein
VTVDNLLFRKSLTWDQVDAIEPHTLSRLNFLNVLDLGGRHAIAIRARSSDEVLLIPLDLIDRDYLGNL